MSTQVEDELIEWLLEGDPAIRWRVLQGLTGASTKEVARERSKVANEGWGARLLAAQNGDGGWGEGVYSPKWTCSICCGWACRCATLPPFADANNCGSGRRAGGCPRPA